VSALDKTSLTPLLERIEHKLFISRGENLDLNDDNDRPHRHADQDGSADDESDQESEHDGMYAAQLEE
jgi:ABC-type Zn2+ transport system substrate-binding protein/surface adhesin